MIAKFKKFLSWVVFSSRNPKEVSMTFTGLAMGVVPWILQASSLACGLHICSGLDQSALTDMIGVLSNIIFWILSIIAAAHVFYGFIRKVILTLDGTNQVLQ